MFSKQSRIKSSDAFSYFLIKSGTGWNFGLFDNKSGNGQTARGVPCVAKSSDYGG